jgi:hypothetical protein
MSSEVRRKALLILIEESLIARRNGLRAALMTPSVACRQRPCGFTKMICYTSLKTWATHEYGYWVRTSRIAQIISHSLRNDDKKGGAFLARPNTRFRFKARPRTDILNSKPGARHRQALRFGTVPDKAPRQHTPRRPGQNLNNTALL